MAGNNEPIDSSRNYPRFGISKYENKSKKEVTAPVTFVKHRKGKWEYVHEPSREYKVAAGMAKFHKKYRGRFDVSLEREEKDNRVLKFLARLSRCKSIISWNGR